MTGPVVSIGDLVRAAHAAERARLTDADLEAGSDAWCEDRAECTPTPANHTDRYRLESEWRARTEAWRNARGVL